METLKGLLVPTPLLGKLWMSSDPGNEGIRITTKDIRDFTCLHRQARKKGLCLGKVY